MGDRPHILVVMVDQLSALFLRAYGHGVTRTPAIDRLAEEGVVFENAYTPSPLCAPARASFMTGQLPTRTGVYDNSAELASSLPTFAHYLRLEGYRTCLSGKMHFVGPDQLHGFEERLTTDVYPGDFGWTPDWSRPGERVSRWYHDAESVKESGVADMTNALEYDDEVAFHAVRRLYHHARYGEGEPLALCVSFTHPHDPYVARRRYSGPVLGRPDRPAGRPRASTGAARSAQPPAMGGLCVRRGRDHGGRRSPRPPRLLRQPLVRR